MSFQSFEKLLPLRQERPKNLPSLEFIALLNQLCLDTDNFYDSKHHILTINHLNQFHHALRNQLKRSFHSFQKELKMLGFKKRKNIQATQMDIASLQLLEEQRLDSNSEESKATMIYIWRGKREAYIKKQLDFSEKHISDLLHKSTSFREGINEKKKLLDKLIEKILFSVMTASAPQERIQEETLKIVKSSKSILNFVHQGTKEMTQAVSNHLGNELSLYRLLIFQENTNRNE